MHSEGKALNMTGALGRTHAPRAVLGRSVNGIPRFQFFEAVRLGKSCFLRDSTFAMNVGKRCFSALQMRDECRPLDRGESTSW